MTRITDLSPVFVSLRQYRSLALRLCLALKQRHDLSRSEQQLIQELEAHEDDWTEPPPPIDDRWFNNDERAC